MIPQPRGGDIVWSGFGWLYNYQPTGGWYMPSPNAPIRWFGDAFGQVRVRVAWVLEDPLKVHRHFNLVLGDRLALVLSRGYS